MPITTLWCYSKVRNILFQCLAILIRGPCFQHSGSGALVYVSFFLMGAQFAIVPNSTQYNNFVFRCLHE